MGPREEVGPGNWAERERQAHWGAAAAMFVEHPILGVGAGAFNDEFRENTTEWRFRISQGHAHNAYLQVAAETGIAGLVAYIALIGVIVWRLLCKIGSLPNNWLARGAAAVTVAVAVHGLFDYLHVLSLGIVLSGIWAFGLAAVPRGVVPRDHYPAL
jgi:O-antigen ligase